MKDEWTKLEIDCESDDRDPAEFLSEMLDELAKLKYENVYTELAKAKRA
jgi:hypothetical protein